MVFITGGEKGGAPHRGARRGEIAKGRRADHRRGHRTFSAQRRRRSVQADRDHQCLKERSHPVSPERSAATAPREDRDDEAFRWRRGPLAGVQGITDSHHAGSPNTDFLPREEIMTTPAPRSWLAKARRGQGDHAALSAISTPLAGSSKRPHPAATSRWQRLGLFESRAARSSTAVATPTPHHFGAVSERDMGDECAGHGLAAGFDRWTQGRDRGGPEDDRRGRLFGPGDSRHGGDESSTSPLPHSAAGLLTNKADATSP